ncbi:MAG: acetolactate synthase-1/2/3 large subunit [Chloroflexi bacterium]|jgi:acetolactate synthase-1/2/3 large subunit|nr:MAG: acetolactate synthase-1/2/3 large subunit [Chloroflexota bacterium]
MPAINGAQAMFQQLVMEGVTDIFSLPGAQIMSAFDVLHYMQDQINLIHTRHEQATTYMADGYAKVSGKPGVAMVVPGPGALNATAGLGTAYASSSPVLLISGQIPSTLLGKDTGQLHEVSEQLDIFKPITKWNHRISDVSEVSSSVHEAFKQMTTGKPGPVELEIAPDILTQSGTVNLIEKELYPNPKATREQITEAVNLISSAKKPTIVAGGGSVSSGASGQVRQLAELLQIPVMTSPQAKGIIPEDSHLATGVNSAIGPAKTVLPDTDLVIAIGTRLSLRGITPDAMPPILQIDVEKDQIGKQYPVELGIVGDASETLTSLISALSVDDTKLAERRERAEKLKKQFADEVIKLASPQVSVIDKISEVLPDDAIVVQGMTNIGYWSSAAMPMDSTRNYVTSSYFGTLGYAFPTALGCQTAFPDRKVVALCGDGGFMYSPQELSTAMRYGLNTVAVVFNNGAFGASRWDQQHQFNGRYIGTDLFNPDFVAMAKSFGAEGIKTDADNIDQGLAEALALDKPTLLEVEIQNMMPPFQIVE